MRFIKKQRAFQSYQIDKLEDGNLTANVPLEMEGHKPGAYDMVFSPSRGG